jgi:DNA-binding CsgD family transcriptional regulator
MSSRFLSGGCQAPNPTRLYNGGVSKPGLWARMDLHADGHTPNDEETIAILLGQLQLTQRQAQVLHWIAEGKTNNEIATILGCSVNTVKMHLKDINQRLGVPNRTAAAACAYRAQIRHFKLNHPLPGRVIPGNLNSH